MGAVRESFMSQGGGSRVWMSEGLLVEVEQGLREQRASVIAIMDALCGRVWWRERELARHM